jgi:hypothetical protein
MKFMPKQIGCAGKRAAQHANENEMSLPGWHLAKAISIFHKVMA